jgi:hypothetical protein
VQQVNWQAGCNRKKIVCLSLEIGERGNNSGSEKYNELPTLFGKKLTLFVA